MFKFLSLVMFGIIGCTPVIPERGVVLWKVHRHPEKVVHAHILYLSGRLSGACHNKLYQVQDHLPVSRPAFHVLAVALQI